MYLKNIPRPETNVSRSWHERLQALHAKTRVALIDYNLYVPLLLARIFHDRRRSRVFLLGTECRNKNKKEPKKKYEKSTR